jgi:hypothetical protein
MPESTAKKMHDKAKANLAGRASEGRSAMASVPADAKFPPDHSENWYRMFPDERNDNAGAMGGGCPEDVPRQG